MKIINKLVKITESNSKSNLTDIIKLNKIDFIDVIDYKWSFPYKLILMSEKQDQLEQYRIFLTESVGNKVKEFFKNKSIEPVNGLFKYNIESVNELFIQLNQLCVISIPISWESIDCEEYVFYEEIMQTKKDFNLVMYLQSDVFKLDRQDFYFINIINKTIEDNCEPEPEIIKAFQEKLINLKKL